MYIIVDDKSRIFGFSVTPQNIAFGTQHETDSIEQIPEEQTDERGILLYKFENGEVLMRTQEEMDADYAPPVIQPTQEERIAALEDENKNAEIHLWFGDGEGNEWGEEINLGFKAIVPDKLTELESGRWILGGQFKSAETKKIEQFLWYSDDKGKTWSDRVTVATDPALNLCETSIIEIADNTLVAFLRENSRRGYDILKCISYDGGETWGDIYATPMDCGHRPAALKLQDGRVMVTYRYIPTESHNFFGAILKTEELTIPERHKQSARIFPIDYDRNPLPDLGYSGSVQFTDGEIYVVTYIKDDAEKAHIRGYSFYPSDIELPKIGNDTRNVF